VTTQFNHRVLAISTLVGALGALVRGVRGVLTAGMRAATRGRAQKSG
jgi:hypothetical protein